MGMERNLTGLSSTILVSLIPVVGRSPMILLISLNGSFLIVQLSQLVNIVFPATAPQLRILMPPTICTPTSNLMRRGFRPVHQTDPSPNSLGLNQTTNTQSNSNLYPVGLSESGSIGYHPIPTPSARNGIQVIGFVKDTKFSTSRGFHDQPVTVEITSSTEGAEIWYTLDGGPLRLG